MISIKGGIKGGQVIVAEPINLPDGSEVTITGHADMNREEVEDNDQPSTVEEIEADLKAMSEFEPVLMTEQEQTRWEGERKARREWEKEN